MDSVDGSRNVIESMKKCQLCDLSETCQTVRIDPDGKGEIVFLGEAPGAEEDKMGRPFIGASGSLLRKILSQLEIDPARYRFTNSVRCRPPGNKTPSQKQIKACLPHLYQEFIDNPPKIIVPLGNTALKSLRAAGLLNIPGTIMNLHGKVIEEGDCLIIPMVHPSYVLQNPNGIEMYKDSMEVLERVVNEGAPPPPEEVSYDFSDKIEDLEAALEEACKHELVAYDIETSRLHPREEGAFMVSFALTWKTKQAFGFALDDSNRDQALKLLHDKLLENSKVRKIIQHAKFELRWSMNIGRTILNMADTMLMHWHVDERNRTHGLDKLALDYTDMGFYSSDLEQYKASHKEADPDKEYLDPKTGEKVPGSYANIPMEILLPYNCMDTDAAFRIYHRLLPLLNERQIWIHDNSQIPSTYPLADMELKGVPIDWDYAEKLLDELPAKAGLVAEEIKKFPEIQQLEKDLVARKKELNLNSDSVVREILFNYIGLESVYMTKGGKPSTDAGVLDYLASKHPVPKLIRDYRGLMKNWATFVKGAFKEQFGGTIHTSYGQAHTETGRLNSMGPNLQNIPRDKLYKKMYVPEYGHWMVQQDYSQIELRIMALQSRDTTLLEYFRKNLDVHRMIAARIHKKDPEDITSEERVRAKRTVFGLCYGQGAKGLAEELGISEEEATAFLNKFFQEFPKVKRWMEKTEKSVIECGYVETMFGRRRRLPDAMIDNVRDPYRTKALRQAINGPIQGTAAQIIEIKMGEIWNWLQETRSESRMLLTVHDSLVSSVPPEEVKAFIPKTKQILEDCSGFDWVNIPILIDVEVGPSWGELIKLTSGEIDQIQEGRKLEDILEEKLSA